MAGTRKAIADIAPRIRGSFIRACAVNEKRGKGLTMLIADSLVKDPINTLKAMASFNPRQTNIDMTMKVEVADIIALAHQRQAELKDITPPVIEAKEQDNNSDLVISQAQPQPIEGQTPSSPEDTPKVPE